jgi:Skp family chaperone for outer membrane proteins
MNNKSGIMGWIVAAVLGGVMLGTGFQSADIKMGVVDIASVVERSQLGKKNQSDFAAMKAAREGVLEFIDDHRVLTNEQAIKFRDLSIKMNRNAGENAELEKLKADIIASDKNAKALSVKQNLTAEERGLMQEYSNRAQSMEQLAQRWYREFTSEMQTWADKQKADSLDKARKAIQLVGKQQGYTIILESGVAPYCANDISDAALKALDEQK